MAEGWFKHEIGAAASYHIRQLAKAMGWSLLLAYARWFVLLEAVYRTDDGMLAFEGSKDVLADSMELQPVGVRMMLDECAGLGMIDAKCWQAKGIVTSEAVMQQVHARNRTRPRTRRKVEKVCEQCGKGFKGDVNASYCSKACKQKAYREACK